MRNLSVTEIEPLNIESWVGNASQLTSWKEHIFDDYTSVLHLRPFCRPGNDICWNFLDCLSISTIIYSKDQFLIIGSQIIIRFVLLFPRSSLVDCLISGNCERYRKLNE